MSVAMQRVLMSFVGAVIPPAMDSPFSTQNMTSRLLMDSLEESGVAMVVVSESERLLHANESAWKLCRQVADLENLTLEEVIQGFVTSYFAEKGKRCWTNRIFTQDGRGVQSSVEVIAGKRFVRNGVELRLFFLVPLTLSERDSSIDPYVLGPLRVDAHTGYVMWGKRYVELTENEFRVLTYLIERADEPVEKADLLRGIWGSRNQGSRVMDITISRLRQKLTDAGAPRELIRTVHGKGYMFRAWDLAESQYRQEPVSLSGVGRH